MGVHLLVAWMNDTLCAGSDILGGFAHVNAPSRRNNEYLLRLVILRLNSFNCLSTFPRYWPFVNVNVSHRRSTHLPIIHRRLISLPI